MTRKKKIYKKADRQPFASRNTSCPLPTSPGTLIDHRKHPRCACTGKLPFLTRIYFCAIILSFLFSLISARDVHLSSLSAPEGFKILGAQTIDRSGFAVSAAGDVNGDGVSDVIIGALHADPLSGSNAGICYVIFGRRAVNSFADVQLTTSSVTMSDNVGFRILGAAVEDNVGYAVAALGDINGDGIDDVIVAAPYADLLVGGNAGIAYVIFGRNLTLPSSQPFGDIQLTSGNTALPVGIGFRILGATANACSGEALGTAGDVNDDGVNDIIVGARDANPSNKPNGGVTYVIFGRSTIAQISNPFVDIQLPNSAMAGNVGFRILGAASGDESGYSVNTAGDCNGDGIDDIIIGAYAADPPAGTDAGISYVIFGRSVATQVTSPFGDIQLPTTALAASVGFRILGAVAGDVSGWSVKAAGDVNGDNIDDVIVGAPRADPSSVNNAGISYIIFGRNIAGGATPFGDIQLTTTTLLASIGFRIMGTTAGQSGLSVSAAGDVNYIFVVNGDGIGDVVVGAPYADPPSGNDAGISYIIFGRDLPGGAAAFGDIQLTAGITTMSESIGFRVLGAAGGSYSGFSVSAAGDVNADGFADVIVGAYYADPDSREGAGISYVIFGAYPLPTSQPSSQPSHQPSSQPSKQPRSLPSSQPTTFPSAQPSLQPQVRPSSQPTCLPSMQPSRQPISHPTMQPTSQPTALPTAQALQHPSSRPSAQPSIQPTTTPSMQPSTQPSRKPSVQPSAQPLNGPSAQPSKQPFSFPSVQPSTQPSSVPSMQPSAHPTKLPSAQPSMQPLSLPSMQPSLQPSSVPSMQPSAQPTNGPSAQPSMQPFSFPSVQPSAQPSSVPSMQPSAHPTKLPSAQPSMQPLSLPSMQPSTQPLSKPSMNPSAQPTKLPSVQPSIQPLRFPSVQPSTQPSSVPSREPSAQPFSVPSVQPSMQPLSLPTTVPSNQPRDQPSMQPSSDPSVIPSANPTVEPSAGATLQPSDQPSAQPSDQPSVQPSIQPSLQPLGMPSNCPSRRPTVAPSLQPSVWPSAQPSALPSCQPFMQPSHQPSGQPSSVPTVVPGEWVRYLADGTKISSRLTYTENSLWVCGIYSDEETSSHCTTLNALLGIQQMWYPFPWTGITSSLSMGDASKVIMSGSTISSETVSAELAICTASPSSTHFTCTALSLLDSTFVAGSYASAVEKLVYIGAYNKHATVTLLQPSGIIYGVFWYSNANMNYIAFRLVQSIPNYVGSFIVGVCSNSASQNYIFAGIVRTDSGSMSAMYLAPISGLILNSEELVNAMVMEYVNPDTFIAGGLQLSDGAGMLAYMVCINSLYNEVIYGMRYIVRESGDNKRRMVGGTSTYTSVVKGMVLVQPFVYMLVQYTDPQLSNNTQCIAVLKTHMNTGRIVQQVQVYFQNASIECTDFAVSDLSFALACTVRYVGNNSQALIISVNKQLTFSKLPMDFARYESDVFMAEPVAFKRTLLPLTVNELHRNPVNYAFNPADIRPSLRPTTTPTYVPSKPTTAAPSGQPSNSPSAAPSVSPQPTSQPSSSGPTNTHKPTDKPTQQPSRAPSVSPTASPTVSPTLRPTARPSASPSMVPSRQPSISPTIKPTRNPTVKASRRPSMQPTIQSSTVTDAPTAPIVTAAALENDDGVKNKKSTVHSKSIGAVYRGSGANIEDTGNFRDLEANTPVVIENHNNMADANDDSMRSRGADEEASEEENDFEEWESSVDLEYPSQSESDDQSMLSAESTYSYHESDDMNWNDKESNGNGEDNDSHYDDNDEEEDVLLSEESAISSDYADSILSDAMNNSEQASEATYSNCDGGDQIHSDVFDSDGDSGNSS